MSVEAQTPGRRLPPPRRLAAQVLAYASFAAAVGVLSGAPAYTHLPPQQALIKLSFTHAGAFQGACRRRSEEELARLAPNMRAPLDCPRRRHPVRVELVLDGRPLYRALLPPSGLARDGASSVHRRFPVPAGRHRLIARLDDRGARDRYRYEHRAEIDLRPAEVLVIEFSAARGGFILHGRRDAAS